METNLGFSSDVPPYTNLHLFFFLIGFYYLKRLKVRFSFLWRSVTMETHTRIFVDHGTWTWVGVKRLVERHIEITFSETIIITTTSTISLF